MTLVLAIVASADSALELVLAVVLVRHLRKHQG